MPTATAGMPAATAPISPKPAGFTKPAGFSRPQTAKAEEDDEPKKDHPAILAISVIALLILAYVCYMQYETDQLPNRQSDDMRVFGAPGAASSDDDSAGAGSLSDDDDSADEESSDEDSDDGEEE